MRGRSIGSGQEMMTEEPGEPEVADGHRDRQM